VDGLIYSFVVAAVYVVYLVYVYIVVVIDSDITTIA
jgi:hypothetical protein